MKAANNTGSFIGGWDAGKPGGKAKYVFTWMFLKKRLSIQVQKYCDICCLNFSFVSFVVY